MCDSIFECFFMLCQTYLPESMKSMRRLREVDVSHNALGSLGSAMEGSGDRLQMLNVDGNPQLDESAMMPVASHAVQMVRLILHLLSPWPIK